MQMANLKRRILLMRRASMVIWATPRQAMSNTAYWQFVPVVLYGIVRCYSRLMKSRVWLMGESSDEAVCLESLSISSILWWVYNATCIVVLVQRVRSPASMPNKCQNFLVDSLLRCQTTVAHGLLIMMPHQTVIPGVGMVWCSTIWTAELRLLENRYYSRCFLNKSGICVCEQNPIPIIDSVVHRIFPH